VHFAVELVETLDVQIIHKDLLNPQVSLEQFNLIISDCFCDKLNRGDLQRFAQECALSNFSHRKPSHKGAYLRHDINQTFCR